MAPRDFRIVIVDDLPCSAEVLAMYLEKGGYNNVEVFECPLEALESLSRRSDDIAPHLIITDFQMPRMTGIELLNRVTAMRRVEGIVITGDPGAVCSTEYPIVQKATPEFFSKTMQLVGESRERCG